MQGSLLPIRQLREKIKMALLIEELIATAGKISMRKSVS